MSMCGICMRNSLCKECKVREARSSLCQIAFAAITNPIKDRGVMMVVRRARSVGIPDSEIERLMDRVIPEA